MTGLQAFLLGLLQGLTEFLPVSSSGHLELGNHLLGMTGGDNLPFTFAVHAATVLSTVVVFRKDIWQLISRGFTFRMNNETMYILKLMLSMVPVAIIGIFFSEEVESLFTGDLLVVGICLLVTASLMAFAHFYRGRPERQMGWPSSLIIGMAQAVAVLPGLSRSGTTIATGILLGVNRREVARFSFLMVLVPVLGAAGIDLFSGDLSNDSCVGASSMVIGFLTAFISGLLSCSWMIRIVSKGKLIYFSLYCLTVGLIAIFAA